MLEKSCNIATEVEDLTDEANGTKPVALGLVLEFIETVTTDKVDRALRSILVTGYNEYCKTTLEIGGTPLPIVSWLVERTFILLNLAGASLSVDKGYNLTNQEMKDIFGQDHCPGLTMSVLGLATHNWLQAKSFNTAAKDLVRNHKERHPTKTSRELALFVCKKAETAIPDDIPVEQELIAV